MTILTSLLLLGLAALGAPWWLGAVLFVLWVLHLAARGPQRNDGLVDG